MEYEAALANIQTIAKLKKMFSDLLDAAALAPDFKALWVSARDFDDCKKGIAEQLGDLTWEAKRSAEEVIARGEHAELSRHMRQESTSYAVTGRVYA